MLGPGPAPGGTRRPSPPTTTPASCRTCGPSRSVQLRGSSVCQYPRDCDQDREHLLQPEASRAPPSSPGPHPAQGNHCSRVVSSHVLFMFQAWGALPFTGISHSTWQVEERRGARHVPGNLSLQTRVIEGSIRSLRAAGGCRLASMGVAVRICPSTVHLCLSFEARSVFDSKFRAS